MDCTSVKNVLGEYFINDETPIVIYNRSKTPMENNNS